MLKINKIINRVTGKRNLSSSAKASEVIYSFNSLLAQDSHDFSQDVIAKTLKNGVLWVEITHPSYGMELRGKLPAMLKDLQDKFGEKVVQKIKTKNV